MKLQYNDYPVFCLRGTIDTNAFTEIFLKSLGKKNQYEVEDRERGEDKDGIVLRSRKLKENKVNCVGDAQDSTVRTE